MYEEGLFLLPDSGVDVWVTLLEDALYDLYYPSNSSSSQPWPSSSASSSCALVIRAI